MNLYLFCLISYFIFPAEGLIKIWERPGVSIYKVRVKGSHIKHLIKFDETQYYIGPRIDYPEDSLVSFVRILNELVTKSDSLYKRHLNNLRYFKIVQMYSYKKNSQSDPMIIVVFCRSPFIYSNGRLIKKYTDELNIVFTESDKALSIIFHYNLIKRRFEETF